MRKLYALLFLAGMSTATMAQEVFEKGKPNDNNYRYLDDYKALKEYIDTSKYPNFKLGIGTTVDEYLQKSTLYKLVNSNFTETVAGNAMKMGLCVDGNGNMDFTKVKNYVNAATEAGLNVYGHTLAWHSQQPVGWLTKLIADKPDPNVADVYTEIVTKDFCKSQSIGSWRSSETEFGYSLKFSSTNGLNIHTTKMCEHSWDVQFLAMENIPVETGKTYKMTMTVKGSEAGKLHSKLGDWKNGEYPDIPFSTEWQDVQVEYKAAIDNSFFMLQCGDFVGDIYIKSIKFEGYKAGSTIPQTSQERHDTLVYAMDKWIKGMMEACDGKVKAWDLVNEAIGGGGDDGEGNYALQNSKQSNSGSWDVGGTNFYWQDYMGSLEYARQACRLARKYGPEDVKLFINDYNLEGTWDIVTKNGVSASKKVWSIVNWIKKWEADGVTKIDGIGTQMHISYNENSSSQSSLKKAITGMFTVMANSGKLVRVSEMDMGYTNASGTKILTANMTEAQHKKMAEFYEWIIKEYLRIVPPAQQWGICQWCPTDAPDVQNMWRRNEPVGIWDLSYYRKHVYAGFVKGLGGGETSGIENIEADNSLDTSKGIYNINGMRMSAKSLSELPSGIYIVNGKKVVK